MTQAIRDAAQSLLDALDNYHLHGSQVGGNRRKDRLRAAANSVRAALSASKPSVELGVGFSGGHCQTPEVSYEPPTPLDWSK